MSSPFRGYTRFGIEDWKNCSHLQIHNATAHEANHEKYRAGNFKDFNFAVVVQVGSKSNGEENADNRNCENGDSVEDGKIFYFESNLINVFYVYLEKPIKAKLLLT